jgi:hypothetical protein
VERSYDPVPLELERLASVFAAVLIALPSFGLRGQPPVAAA